MVRASREASRASSRSSVVSVSRVTARRPGVCAPNTPLGHAEESKLRAPIKATSDSGCEKRMNQSRKKGKANHGTGVTYGRPARAVSVACA